MIDNLEFNNSKQVRKTLLIVSFLSIMFKKMIKYSTGNIEFIGFKIPVSDANIIPEFISYLTIYYCVALVLRYFDDEFKSNFDKLTHRYEKGLEFSKDPKGYQHYDEIDNKMKPNGIIRKGVIFIDLIFPLIFGFFSICYVFFTD